MNATTRKALEDSIAHWARLVTGNRQEGEAPDWRWCALCARFYNPSDQCDGCPVKEETGVNGCDDTPYIYAANAWDAHGKDSPEFRRAARKVLAFLASLRPTTEQTTEKGKKQ